MIRSRRLAWLFSSALLLAGCTEDPTKSLEPKEVPGAVQRLREGKSPEIAESRLSRTARSLTNGELAKLLEDESARPEARAAVVRIMARTADWEGIPGIAIARVTDSAPEVRRAVLDALIDNASPEHRASLSALQRQQTDETRRKELEDAVAAMAAREKMWHMRRLTQSQDAVERAITLRRISEIGGAEDAPLFLKLYREAGNDTLMKQELLLGLARFGGQGAKDLILAELMADAPHVRSIAAVAEQTLADPRAVEPLGVLLASEVLTDTRVSSAKALAIIGTKEARSALEAGCKNPPEKKVEVACRESLAAIAKK